MATKKNRYDVIVVGSGAGGGTLVRELANKGRDVLCIEWGSPIRKMGEFWDCREYWDFKRLPEFLPKFMQKVPLVPPRTKEGVILWRAVAQGGTTVISAGNGARCMEHELSDMGVDLSKEFVEVEKELGITRTAERMLSKGSRAIREASKALGYDMEMMPKFVDPRKCTKCHKCIYGCAYKAKWDALAWIAEAGEKGADFVYETKVLEVTHANGAASGIVVKGPGGRREIKAKTVVLAAGGMATPVILQNSGIPAGDGFFVDLMWNTYGVTKEKGLNQDHEPVMALVDLSRHGQGGFLLSPFMNHTHLGRLQEMNPLKALTPSSKLLSIMTKITDDANGSVFPDGTTSKPVTERDWQRLREGARIAREVLVKAGAEPGSLFESKVQGAHPGGTAAIGTVVDTDLQTKIDNLFVCDASVFPAREFNDRDRLPPILTILALAKRLARHLL